MPDKILEFKNGIKNSSVSSSSLCAFVLSLPHTILDIERQRCRAARSCIFIGRRAAGGMHRIIGLGKIQRCCRNLRSKPLQLLRRSVAGITTDISGNPIGGEFVGLSDRIDECIIDIISSNASCVGPLSDIIELHASYAFARILLVYEELRQSSSASSANIEANLQSLEEALHAGTLSDREALYSAGALAWYEGNYARSGALLESVLLEHPGDLIALRLAQDAYMAGGSERNALGCLIRHPSPSSRVPHLHGYLLGMLAAGCVEAGRMEMAEEIGQRAVEVTRGQNVWALHALLNCYQLTGRSSDMHARLDDSISKHDGTTGSCSLLFNTGCGHIMKGNYSGGFKAFENIVDVIESEKALKRESSTAFNSATLLLWKLSETTPKSYNGIFDPVWSYLALANNHGSTGSSTPMNEVCASLALTRGAVENRGTFDFTPYIISPEGSTQEEPPKASEGTSGSWWSRLTQTKAPESESPSGSSSSEKPPPSSMKMIASYVHEKYNASSEEVARGPSLYHEHILRLGSISDAGGKAPRTVPTSDDAVRHPSLRSVLPNLSIATISSSALTSAGLHSEDANCRSRSIRKCVLPLSEALYSFQAGNYTQASSALLQLPRDCYKLAGGTAAQREVLEQMSLEALYRDKQFDMAQMLLVERSAIVPSDAQCWRRLAEIYASKGQRALSEEAQYTAWQLGIGQGGFGGPT